MTTCSGTKEYEGATFVRASLMGATVRFSDVSGVTMRGVPLVDAELNRQFPGRELQKAQTPDGLREGWVAVQAAGQTTMADTPPDLVDAHVEDEWSLAQTLRHLILATDAWLRGGVLGVPQPFHEIGQVFTGADRMGVDMSVFRVDPWGGGDWRPSVGDCIRVVLEEEWAHLRYTRRDLARLR